jgi:hypothetical protein
MQRKRCLIAYPISCVLLFSSSLRGGPSTTPLNLRDLIARSVAANERDYKAAPSYSYKERDREGQSSKTFEVTMIAGSPYRRLIAISNRELPKAEKAREELHYRREVKRRSQESRAERRQRISKYETERRHDHELMGQLTAAFEFKLVGEDKLDAFDVYVLKATPKQGYQPPNLETRVLTGMQGQLWIDKSTYQWVKVTANVIHPVSIKGFLAEVEPGTLFELEKMPVGDGIWQPKHFSMKSHARVLFFHKNGQEDQTYFDYRKQP